jgi:beta-lysine 5,6-aminomutase alpha subunit
MVDDLRQAGWLTADLPSVASAERKSSVSGARPAGQPAVGDRQPGRLEVGKLDLDRATVRRARSLARQAGRPIVSLARTHSTVSVERAVLRLAGVRGADADGTPWVNRLVDAVRDEVGLEHGVALPVWDAVRRTGGTGGPEAVTQLAQRAAAGRIGLRVPDGRDAERARRAAYRDVGRGVRQIDRRRAERDRLVRRIGDAPRQPWIYLIVATGDIYEDIPQARAAAREGADVIAVIRSTGQSLLDYVPEGATREGYAGTYATQENFRLMRAALDDVSKELGRYVRLTNYASGLCMPEIATLAGLERLDMMLNDSMYGILFRDINPIRTFVDQRFSRQVHARAGIIINTGEDNYLTTADAVDEAHTVTVSQLLNEYFAKEAGLEDWQLGLGHAFEINPDLPDSFRLELAHALLARELFPDAPLKWMPPTRHMTGDVFRGYLLDGFFNLVGALTGQGILLVGMMTEAVVTPFLSDRDLALQNVRYVLDAAGRLHEDFRPAPGGVIQSRAHQVLDEAVALLEKIVAEPGDAPLLEAIGDGTFGLMKRPADGGKGLDGVVRTAPGYYNPAAEILEASPSEPSDSGRRRGGGPADTSPEVGT